MGKAPLPKDTVSSCIYLLKTGMPQSQIARDLKISQSSVSRYKKLYLEGEDMDSIVAGDKYHGLLKAVGNGVFEGTCRGAKGKMHKKIFHCKDSEEARMNWEKWCGRLHRELEKKQDTKSEPEVLDIPTLPEPIVVESKRTNNPPQVIYRGVLEEALSKSIETEEAKKHQTTTLYILAVGEPKIAGFFVDFQQAMQTEALMNTALQFAGVDARYQVMEVKRYQAPVV